MTDEETGLTVTKPLTTKRLKRCGCAIGQAELWVTQAALERAQGGSPVRARVRGVETCGSVHSCPVCSYARAREHRLALTQIMLGARVTGYHWALVTLTVPHQRRDALEQTRGLVAGAWRRVLQGRQWQALKEQLGLCGYARALEVTVGPKGWHPHIHALLGYKGRIPEKLTDRERAEWLAYDKRLFAGYLRPIEAEEMARMRRGVVLPEVESLEGLQMWIKVRWSKAVAAELRAQGVENARYHLPRAKGVDVRAGDAASKYLSKLGLEVVESAHKVAHDGHSTHWQLLHRVTHRAHAPRHALTRSDLTARAQWQEYCEGMHRKRWVTYSRGLKRRFFATFSDHQQKRLDAAERRMHRPPPACVVKIPARQWRGVWNSWRATASATETVGNFASGVISREELPAGWEPEDTESLMRRSIRCAPHPSLGASEWRRPVISHVMPLVEQLQESKGDTFGLAKPKRTPKLPPPPDPQLRLLS